jgi:hypothetical protein
MMKLIHQVDPNATKCFRYRNPLTKRSLRSTLLHSQVEIVAAACLHYDDSVIKKCLGVEVLRLLFGGDGGDGGGAKRITSLLTKRINSKTGSVSDLIMRTASREEESNNNSDTVNDDGKKNGLNASEFITPPNMKTAKGASSSGRSPVKNRKSQSQSPSRTVTPSRKRQALQQQQQQQQHRSLSPPQRPSLALAAGGSTSTSVSSASAASTGGGSTTPSQSRHGNHASSTRSNNEGVLFANASQLSNSKRPKDISRERSKEVSLKSSNPVTSSLKSSSTSTGTPKKAKKVSPQFASPTISTRSPSSSRPSTSIPRNTSSSSSSSSNSSGAHVPPQSGDGTTSGVEVGKTLIKKQLSSGGSARYKDL